MRKYMMQTNKISIMHKPINMRDSLKITRVECYCRHDNCLNCASAHMVASNFLFGSILS